MTDALGHEGSSFLDSLGERARRRPEPRLSISLAGSGCVLGVLGVLVLAADTGLDDDTGEFSRVPGLLLSALVIATGYYLLAFVRRGPIATAGTVAAALGVPALMFFATFEEEGFPPYNTEAILIVSTAVWLGTYALGPAKGRPFFLGAGLVAFWFTVLELTENVFDSPFDLFGGFFGTSGTFEETGTSIDPSTGQIIETGGDFGRSGGFDPPDPATIGMLSLLLGVAFLLASRWLDKNERHGAATPVAFVAIPCLAVGVIGLASDLEAAGSGLLLVAIGLALSYSGSTVLRRATSWIGGAATALGLALFLGDMAGDSATTGGLLYIAGGIALVFVGHLVATATSEPDELMVTTDLAAVPSGPRILVAEPAAPLGTDADVDADWKPPVPPPATPPTTDEPPDPPPPPE